MNLSRFFTPSLDTFQLKLIDNCETHIVRQRANFCAPITMYDSRKIVRAPVPFVRASTCTEFGLPSQVAGETWKKGIVPLNYPSFRHSRT
jgi:hypothetical protein